MGFSHCLLSLALENLYVLFEFQTNGEQTFLFIVSRGPHQLERERQSKWTNQRLHIIICTILRSHTRTIQPLRRCDKSPRLTSTLAHRHVHSTESHSMNLLFFKTRIQWPNVKRLILFTPTDIVQMGHGECEWRRSGGTYIVRDRTVECDLCAFCSDTAKSSKHLVLVFVS